ncbi:glycosyltransferase family 2 protein [Campylobacter concisus]|uniref:TIGR04283 family arsenosugar biosynthesis glycosyltransferase n=1 Tax=Campylobacter concisus TaxID=199 RepID=UPI00188443D4|nr:glycosyltransferase family 2 protein [Campylobacter concisus]
MAISVITPIYNEPCENLERFCALLAAQKGEFEVIFADASEPNFYEGKNFDLALNLSKIFTPERFKILPCKKGRGAQLDAGASVAKFEKLLFLHADSAFCDEGAILAAQRALDRCEAGCFRFKFDEDGVLLNLIALGSNLRVKFRNIAFGDQGIFIRKGLFNALGGFENLAIMEDYKLSIKLKRSGVKFCQLAQNIITSARKFRREGVIKTLIKMQILQYKFRNGASADEIAKSY